ncbi:MAG: hypothetical protein MUF34_16085, partial [Polyangiaceae bacterium]|nr:hypothetical protein [Polyangiaceae bacterium]
MTLAVSVGLAVAAQGACTVVFNQSSDQCSTNEDCVSRGPEFLNAQCTPERTCLVINDGTRCTTNAECLERNGNLPYFCRKEDNVCVALTNAACTEVLAEQTDLADDNAVYIGLMSVPSGAPAPVGYQVFNGAELARRQIKQIGGGLPGPSPNTPVRPLVLIGCDEQLGYPDIIKLLVDDVHVPAIIGPTISGNYISAVGSVIPKDVLLLSAVASSPAISTLPKSPLKLRSNPSDGTVVRIFAKYLLPDLESRLRASGVVPAGEPLKLFVLQRGDSLGAGLLNTLLAEVTLNGVSATDAVNAGTLKVQNYGDPFDKVNNPNPAQKFVEAAQLLADFKPHVVYMAGTSEIPDSILTPAEQAWTETRYRPVYVGLDNTETPGLLALLGRDASFRARYRTMAFGAVQYDVFTQFQGVYSTNTFKNAIPPGRYAAQGYDAAMLIAYGIAAAGPGPLTGTSIGAGIRKTQPGAGPPVNARGDNISQNFVSLARTATWCPTCSCAALRSRRPARRARRAQTARRARRAQTARRVRRAQTARRARTARRAQTARRARAAPPGRAGRRRPATARRAPSSSRAVISASSREPSWAR